MGLAKRFHSFRLHTVLTLAAVCCLVGSLASVELLVLPTQEAGAATDVVTSCSGDPSVAGSLPNVVGTASAGDTITFALDSCPTITLTSRLDVSGLTIDGPGPNTLTLDGDGSTGILSSGSSGTTDISGLTFDSGEDVSSGGGGISNTGGTLIISNCIFSNDAADSGGAIWSGGSLTVSDTTFIGDSSQNESIGGGALMVASGTAGVSDSTFVSNSTIGVGGAVLNEGTMTVTNSTFTNNFSPDFGGAIDNAVGGTTAIENSTLSGDQADAGGGEVENTGGSTMTIQATILADGAPGNCEADGPITDLGYNLDAGSTCGFTAPSSLSNTDPDLDPGGLQSNGGLTQTIALEPGSAAIGAVTDPSLCPATDQRGVPRPTTCDIGAYESTPLPTISSVTFAGSRSAPTVTVSGSGFGSESDLGTPTAPFVCGSSTGLNYGNEFYFSDGTDLPEGSWQGGQGPNDCVGVLISSYSSSQVTFTFGSDYSSFPGVRTGDGITMTVLGTTFNGIASLETGAAYVIDGSDVTPVNLATNTAGSAISFGGGSQPSAIAINPGGTVAYVADGGLGTVDPITMATNTPGTPIAVGGADSVPEGIAISPDGRTAYVANQNGTVDPVDLVTDTAESLITIPDSILSAIAISPDGQTAYVTDEEQGEVYPITLATDSVGSPIGLGDADANPDSIAITPDGTKAFVVTNGDGSLIPIDLSTDTAGSPNDDAGVGAQYVVISPDGSTVYVSNNTEPDEDLVTEMDTVTNTTQSSIGVDFEGSGSLAIAPDGATLYAGTSGQGLTAVPTDIFAVGTAAPVCHTSCGQLAIAPDQAPAAALSVTPGPAGGPTAFDASASVAGSTPIVDYAWDFGDGHTADTATPTTTHTYASSGAYTATVTETDAAGTSTTQVFTGQTASRNGGPQAKATSTFNVGTNYTCTVSGMSGTTSFPVVESESPAPPASIDAGGTFSTAPAARVTIPASVLNHFRSLGATSLTIASQSTAIDGRASVGGPLSGAVSPAVETASASNLPQSHAPLVAGVPFTYSTTYNPVTFQTGPGTGTVFLTPGAISAAVTFVIHNTPTPETISCSPPSGVAALGSTTVDPPPATPTFQVPGSTPPLQNQVSAGSAGGWQATIANTSTASVTGLVAHVSVTDGGAPVSFDLTGMAASGTSCSNAGSGKLTCAIGTLTKGASTSLNVLVNTTGLSGSVAITGSATVSSSNAGSHTTTLSAIGVVVVQAGNGTKAVATPGTALVSTKKPLNTAKASVSLTLPKAKITKKASGGGGSGPSAGTTTVSPPPVAVTLESLAPSAEPALCPPTGSFKCEGNIVQVFGDFSAYTSKLHPIVTVVKFFYGLKVPAGSVYFLKPNGKTVKKLSTCKKTSTGYDTPCVFGKEQTLGSAAHDSLYAQDTVYFTGNDPAMGRR